MTNDDLQFEQVAHCLNIRAVGRYIVVQKEAAIVAIASALKSPGIKTVFVDFRQVPGPYTFTDRCQLGELAAKHLQGWPIAVLATDDQVDEDRIAMVVAQNRGSHVEVFTDEAAARTWLQKYLTPAL